MKKYLPVIAIALVIVAAMAVVIKNISDEKNREKEYISHVQSILDNTDFSAEAVPVKKYQFTQMDPETGLYSIYDFIIFKNEKDELAGTIHIENADTRISLACGVITEGDADTFLFGRYLGNVNTPEDLAVGDVLIRLHSKDGNIVPEFVKLNKLYPGEDIVRSY